MLDRWTWRGSTKLSTYQLVNEFHLPQNTILVTWLWAHKLISIPSEGKERDLMLPVKSLERQVEALAVGMENPPCDCNKRSTLWGRQSGGHREKRIRSTFYTLCGKSGGNEDYLGLIKKTFPQNLSNQGNGRKHIMERKVQLQLKHVPQCSLHRKLEVTEFQELSVLVSGT